VNNAYSEVIRSRRAFLQITGEKGLIEASFDGVKESLRWSWGNRVDAAEGQANKTIVVSILSKLR
jgi:hypothetical protein